MENEQGNVETDSMIDFVIPVRDAVGPTDHIADSRAHALVSRQRVGSDFGGKH